MERIEEFKAHLKDSKGNLKAELDVYVSKGGLKLVKIDGKVLGAFPLQRIQQWGISAPGTFKLQVVTGEKVVGLVIHGDPDEVVAIIDCLERQVAQIIEDTRAQEEGREPVDVSSPPRRIPPEPEDEVQAFHSDPEPEPEPESEPEPEARGLHPEPDETDMVAEEISDEDIPRSLSASDFSDEVRPFRPDNDDDAAATADVELESSVPAAPRVMAFESPAAAPEPMPRRVGHLEPIRPVASSPTAEEDRVEAFSAPSPPRGFAADFLDDSPGSGSESESESEAAPEAAPRPASPRARPSTSHGTPPRSLVGGVTSSGPPGHSPESRMAATMAAATAEEISSLKRRLREAESRAEAEVDKAKAEASYARKMAEEERVARVAAEGRADEAESRAASAAAEAAEAERSARSGAGESARVEEALERELASANERVESASKNAEDARRAAEEANRRAEEANRRISAAEDVAAEAGERAAAAEANFAALSDAVAERDAEIAALRSAESTNIRQDAGAAEALAERAERAEARAEEAERNAAAAAEASESRRRAAEEAECRAEAAEAKLADVVDARDAHDAEMKSQLEAAEKRAEEAKAEAEAAKAEAEEAKAEAEEAKAEASESQKKAFSEVPAATTAAETMALVDDLRARVASAETERAAAIRRADAAETARAAAEARAVAAENLASAVDAAAAKALERADAAESAAKERDANLAALLKSQEGVAERDMTAVARAEGARAAAAETRVKSLERRLEAAAAAREDVSRRLAETTAEAAEARGSAEAAREALEEAFQSARTVAARETAARKAQAEAEARLAAVSAETEAASARASAVEELRTRAEIAEKRLEAAARDGARAAARARAETSEWRARANALERRLASSRVASAFAVDEDGRFDRNRNRDANSGTFASLSPGYEPARWNRNADGDEAEKTSAPASVPPTPPPEARRSWTYPAPPPTSGFGSSARSSPGRAYAAQYHARGGEGCAAGSPGKGKAAGMLTADFLDSLGSRLSSVRELLSAAPAGEAPRDAEAEAEARRGP